MQKVLERFRKAIISPTVIVLEPFSASRPPISAIRTYCRFETLLELLRQAGYEVKGKKVPSLLGGEQKKFIRMDTLGDGYTPADLRAVIAGEKAHTPQKNAAAPVKPEKRSGNLLVDIQAKLRADKGAGYARWATLFNLKQMAQTVAYLQDHELLDYAILSEKAAAASAHFNELSARIKSAETRMAEIAVLREHIVNYAKTRDTYVAYRKAGYSVFSALMVGSFLKPSPSK